MTKITLTTPAPEPKLVLGPRTSEAIAQLIREIEARAPRSDADRRQLHRLRVLLHLGGGHA